MKARSLSVQIFLTIGIFVLLLTAPTSLIAQANSAPATASAAPATFRVGGTAVAIPSPADGLPEMGDDYRVVMEVFVPNQNRLVAAFVSPEDFALLKSGKLKSLPRYALVEVPRTAEFMDLTPVAFKEVIDSTNKEMGSNLDADVKQYQVELNQRMKDLNLEKAKVGLNKPIALGRFFSEQDAYGLGMMMPVKADGTTTRIVAGIVLLRIKNRLVFGYLYSVYKDEETLSWVRKSSEEWADAILKANRQ